MKAIIEKLKKLTGRRTDPKIATFLGVSKSTITLEKRGQKTKLHTVLPMLEYLISGLSKAKLQAFLEKFKEE